MAHEGNGRRSIGADIAEQVGAELIRADAHLYEYGKDYAELHSLTIQTTWKRGDSFLVVGRFEVDGHKLVSFHSADSLYGVLRGFFTRFNNKSLEFKEDSYA